MLARLTRDRPVRVALAYLNLLDPCLTLFNFKLRIQNDLPHGNLRSLLKPWPAKNVDLPIQEIQDGDLSLQTVNVYQGVKGCLLIC